MTATQTPDYIAEFENQRGLISPTNRMYPDWEGEIRMEQWFMKDELQAGESLWIMEKFSNRTTSVFVLRVLLEDIAEQMAEMAGATGLEGEAALSPYVYPWVLPIRRLYSHPFPEFIDELAKDEKKLARVAWILNAIKAGTLWQQIEMAYRVAELAKQRFWEVRDPLVMKAEENPLNRMEAGALRQSSEMAQTLSTIQEDIRVMLTEMKALMPQT